jgi:hypothetical protein
MMASLKKETPMSAVAEKVRIGGTAAVKTAVLKTKASNPAIQRLKARVLGAVEPSTVITSYDRMHHRHSRSPG